MANKLIPPRNYRYTELANCFTCKHLQVGGARVAYNGYCERDEDLIIDLDGDQYDHVCDGYMPTKEN